MFIIIISIIILSFSLLMLLNVTISLAIRQRDAENDTRLKISLLRGLISFKIEIPKLILKEVNNIPTVEMVTHLETSDGAPIHEFKERAKFRVVVKRIHQLIDLIKDYWGITKYLMKSTKVKSLEWKTEFGLSDPAITGVLVGSLWSIKGMALSVISKFLTLQDRRPKIQVIPKFQQSRLYSDINCIFAIRIGHIIIATIRFLIKFLRSKGVK